MRYTNSSDAYYAVIKIKTLVRNGVTGQVVNAFAHDRIGPYDKPGPAKAAVTRERKYGGRDFVEGWVEVSTGWAKLDD